MNRTREPGHIRFTDLGDRFLLKYSEGSETAQRAATEIITMAFCHTR